MLKLSPCNGSLFKFEEFLALMTRTFLSALSSGTMEVIEHRYCQ